MKKHVLLIFLLTVLCFGLVLTLNSCSDDTPEGGDGQGVQVADQYGFMRPMYCWLTECMILPQAPDSMEKMFGTGGVSGLAGEEILKDDGRISESGEYYLVCLVYGTPSLGGEIKTNLKFSYIDDTTVLHNDACVTTDEITVSGNLELTEHYLKDVHLQSSADRRVFVKYKYASYTPDTYNTVQGMLVIPFRMKHEPTSGTLQVELSLDVEGITGEYKTDSKASLDFGNTGSGSAKAQITQLSVNYLTPKAYNGGNYAESDLSKDAPFTNGGFCYMVVDLTVKALEAGDAAREIRAMAVVPDRNKLAIGIEEAPTGKIAKTTQNDTTVICTSYSLPATAGEEKKIRMVFFLRPVNGGEVEMDLFVDGAGSFSVSGEVWEGPAVTVPENVLVYTLNSDGRSYSVTGFLETIYNLESPVIPDCWGPDSLPVTAIGGCAFENSELKEITIPASVTSIGPSAFWANSNLVSVNFEENSQLTSIGDHAFYGCRSLASIAIPFAGTDPTSDSAFIGKQAFMFCSQLTTLTLPTTVTIYVGEEAFKFCEKLADVYYTGGDRSNINMDGFQDELLAAKWHT